MAAVAAILAYAPRRLDRTTHLIPRVVDQASSIGIDAHLTPLIGNREQLLEMAVGLFVHDGFPCDLDDPSGEPKAAKGARGMAGTT